MDLPAFSAFSASKPAALYLVLRAMFAERRVAEGGLRLEKPFEGNSLRAACSFLRCLYSPEDACAANFRQLGQADTLVQVARLADQLDAAALLAKLERQFKETSLAVAVSWTELAERCHMDDLYRRCIYTLATSLVFTRPVPTPGSMHAAAPMTLAHADIVKEAMALQVGWQARVVTICFCS
ncbi:hypothetical protein ABPG75_004176 [Micractinium tetrahymenae]